MYKEKYSMKAFSKLILTEAYEWVTYIVNGYVFIFDKGKFKRMNSEALTLEKTIELEELAKDNNEHTMLVYLGDDHTKRMCEYLDFIKKNKPKQA